MSNKPMNIGSVTDKSEIVAQMAACFAKAFPTAAELAEWIGDAIGRVMDDGKAKAAEDVVSLTFQLCSFALPKLIKTRTEAKRIEVLQGHLAYLFNGAISVDEYKRAVSFISYKTNDGIEPGEELSDFTIRTIKQNEALKVIGVMGIKYKELLDEEMRLRREQCQKEKDQELHDWYMAPLRKSLKEQDHSLDVTVKVPHLEFPALFDQKARKKDALRLEKTKNGEMDAAGK